MLNNRLKIEGTVLCPSYEYEEKELVKELILPEGITEISPMTFSFWSDLEYVEVPEGVTHIGYEAFMGCENLREVILPDSLEQIDDHIFWDCKSLKKVKFPKGLKKITDNMFLNCTELQEIQLPKQVKIVAHSAFRGCTKLIKVSLPDGIEIIEEGAFADCKKLKKINLIHELEIKPNAFNGCKALCNKEGFLIVGDRLAAYNGKEEIVYIPDSVKIVEREVFKGNKKIVEVYFPNGFIDIKEEAFKNCSNLKKVSLPEGFRTIGREAFWDCKALEEINIPEGVKVIEENVFRHCYGLKTIRLPYSVKKIKEKAFSGTLEMNSMDNIICIAAPGTPIDSIEYPQDRFAATLGYLKNSVLYVDDEIKSTYKKFISKNYKKLLPFIFAEDMYEGLKILDSIGKITKKNIHDEYLEMALEHKATQCTVFLMEWAKSYCDIETEFEL